jgi:hypothetical protein
MNPPYYDPLNVIDLFKLIQQALAFILRGMGNIQDKFEFVITAHSKL